MPTSSTSPSTSSPGRPVGLVRHHGGERDHGDPGAVDLSAGHEGPPRTHGGRLEQVRSAYILALCSYLLVFAERV